MSETTFDVAAAQAAGVVTEQKAPADYWGFDENENWYFPDGIQYLVLRKMNEGQRAKYQKATRSDVYIQRNSGDARMKADPAQERWALIETSVIDWHMYRGGQQLPWNPRTFKEWYEKADPRIIEDLEKACRKINPWLLGEMTVEDIDREIENLQEMRQQKLEEEAGESSSSNR